MRKIQCRLVLLKNRRCSIVRQLRQDVAQLLKLDHAQIAFTRVEQLYKDERIVEVYDLLDRFCEFVVINLKYIRRHKDCPNDINEAISSLIFASARCGDIPELRRARKLFAERYGSHFVMSALELLPGNLVNSQIRNNLSIKTVAEDVKIKLMNEIFRDNHILHVQGSSESARALEYKSEWHQQQVQDVTLDVVQANENVRAEEGEVLCITLPVSSPADQHLSPSKALVPVTEVPARLENIASVGNPDESRILTLETLSHTSDELVQCLEENVVYLDDIQEFQTPKSKDINLLDQRVFIFQSLVLPNKHKMEDGLPSTGSFKKSSKACNRRWRNRSLSKEYWSFKDLSYKSYYGNKSSAIWATNTCKSNPGRKQLKYSLECSCIRASPSGEHEPSQTRLQSSHEDGMEETKDSEFYSCSDCSSRRSISMPTELHDKEQHTCLVKQSSLPVQQLELGNHIHHKVPDYKELESAFFALKNDYLLSKNRESSLI